MKLTKEIKEFAVREFHKKQNEVERQNSKKIEALAEKDLTELTELENAVQKRLVEMREKYKKDGNVYIMSGEKPRAYIVAHKEQGDLVRFLAELSDLESFNELQERIDKHFQ